MAAQSYYHPQLEHQQDALPLKPMQLANPTAISVSTTASSSTAGSHATYNPLPSDNHPNSHTARLHRSDRRLKAQIRILRLVSRILATILSIATLVPMIMTIVKYLQTKDTYYTLPDGTRRTAWANDSIVWYTYMYAGVSAISTIFNIMVMIGYLRAGVRGANKMADVSGWWEYFVLGVNFVVWAVSVGVYRYGKEPVDGKFRDLWGWTCSNAAQQLQDVLVVVNFQKFCNVQGAAFSIGVTNVVTMVLSGLTFALVLCRRRSKARLELAAGGEEFEPLRG